MKHLLVLLLVTRDGEGTNYRVDYRSGNLVAE
jgi:hypothetical protein